MKLGSSLRRRRGGSAGAGRQTEESGAPRWPWRPGSGRLFLAALAMLAVGSGTGYVYATQVVFPAPEIEVQEFREVPDLRQMTLDEAETTLGPLGLEVARVDSVHHPDVPAGLILGQTPLPGQLGVPGPALEITMSAGPERRPVPDVSRLVASRAVTVLESTGFEVELDSLEAHLPPGRVVETDPPAGEEVELPSLIRLTVSLGPPLVELPDLVGMQEEEARAVLESLGLEVGEVDTVFRFGFNQGEVLEQIPEAGQEIPEGSVVRLVVGRRGFLRDPGG
jgi:eukaryotic-like serine/threonine-protein kinase